MATFEEWHRDTFRLFVYLFEVHNDATLLHHGVLLIVIHQLSQGIEPLTATHVILTILLQATPTTNSHILLTKLHLPLERTCRKTFVLFVFNVSDFKCVHLETFRNLLLLITCYARRQPWFVHFGQISASSGNYQKREIGHMTEHEGNDIQQKWSDFNRGPHRYISTLSNKTTVTPNLLLSSVYLTSLKINILVILGFHRTTSCGTIASFVTWMS